jgi:hypothetical protein
MLREAAASMLSITRQGQHRFFILPRQNYVYTILSMIYEWDEAKRAANLKKHGLDLFSSGQENRKEDLLCVARKSLQ